MMSTGRGSLGVSGSQSLTGRKFSLFFYLVFLARSPVHLYLLALGDIYLQRPLVFDRAALQRLRPYVRTHRTFIQGLGNTRLILD